MKTNEERVKEVKNATIALARVLQILARRDKQEDIARKAESIVQELGEEKGYSEEEIRRIKRKNDWIFTAGYVEEGKNTEKRGSEENEE